MIVTSDAPPSFSKVEESEKTRWHGIEGQFSAAMRNDDKKRGDAESYNSYSR